VFKRVAAALLALLMAVGPALTPPALRWVRTTVTITVDGLARSYLLVRPVSVASSLPVLMELHGCCTTPEYELTRSGFKDVTGPAILVYPAGYHEYWNAGACCGDTRADDAAFITAVVRRVLAGQADADPSRVYLAGYSNGGRMAYRIACSAPALFTSIAVYGAVDAQACPAPAPVSLLVSAGTADPEVAVTALSARHTVNGYLEPTVDDEIAQYRAADGCPAAPVTVAVSGSLTSRTWTSCVTGAIVQLSLYAGGDHAWPSSVAAVMWTFFTTSTGRPAVPRP
jgi:polyhydroxybutyrate depolymerase